MASDQKVNVLLVDDNAENLVALESVLEDPGLHLVKAYSGLEALKHLLDEDFAVILLCQDAGHRWFRNRGPDSGAGKDPAYPHHFSDSDQHERDPYLPGLFGGSAGLCRQTLRAGSAARQSRRLYPDLSQHA